MRRAALATALVLSGSLGLVGCDGDEHKNEAPVARISASPQSGPTPLIVTLDGSLSADWEDKIESYAWATGDGAALSGVTVTHTYERPGEFTVTLTVTDHKGKTSTTSEVVKVQNRPPEAAFKPYQAEGFAGAVVRFDATASSDPDGEIESLEWDLGDGTWATGPIVEHRYAVAGEYTVLLRVRDQLGAESQMSENVSLQSEEEFPAYRIEHLECDDCLARQISSSGAIVFSYDGPGVFRGTDYLYQDGVLSALVGPSGHRVLVADMNDKGQMTGRFRETPGGRFLPEMFVYNRGDWTIVPPPEDALRLSPVAINEHGDVVANAWRGESDADGYACVVDGNRCDRIWPEGVARDMNDYGDILVAGSSTWIYRNGAIEVLPLDQFMHASVKRINNSGQALLYEEKDFSSMRALLYSDGQFLDLGDLGGGVGGPLELTNSGWVLGWALEADGTRQGFRWHEGRMEPFGPSEMESAGLDINEPGDMVGYVADDGASGLFTSSIYVKSHTGRMHILVAPYPYSPAPKYPRLRAAAMNDLGEVVITQAYSSDPYDPDSWHPLFSHRATPVSVLFSRLLEADAEIPVPQKLSPVLTSALKAHEEMDLPASCELLYEYDDWVRALTPGSLSQAQADRLRAQTAAIEETLLCP
jgi:PKD repeat protein